MSGPPAAALLDLLEPGWRRHLESGEPAQALDIEPELLTATTRTLGRLARSGPPAVISVRWPACLVVALAQVTARDDRTGKVWPAWHRAIGCRVTSGSRAGWSEAFARSLSALGIPAAATDPLAAVRAQASAAGPAGTAGTGRAEAPVAALRLRLDPFGRGVLARDTGTSEVGASDTDPGCAWPDPAAAGDWDSVSPRELTDLDDPLLAFGADGDRLAALPPEPVWLVCPAGQAPRSDAGIRVLVESRLPLAWAGWRLIQVDLAAASWLELAPADGSGPVRHRVRGRSRPRLVTTAAVPGITTAGGRPVLSAPPRVWLPAGGTRWRMEVRRSGNGPVLATAEATGDDWVPERLWDRVRRPLLGELTISVTVTAPGDPADGAPGSGIRRTFAVAEGLGVSCSPAPRLVTEHGLEAAEVLLAVPPGMTASPCAALIPAGAERAELTCVAGPVVLALLITPPHGRFRVEPGPGGAGTATGWHSQRPLRLRGADLASGGSLRLDLPGIAGDPPVEVVASGKVVQLLEPARSGGYQLRRILDTVRAHGGGELRISLGSRTARIASISDPGEAGDPWLGG